MSIQEINKNAILSGVMQKVIDQTEKGLQKYGKTVDPDDYSTIEWLNHLQEELIDGAVYIETLKVKMTEVAK